MAGLLAFWRLGLGVALGWAALAPFWRLASRARHSPPAAYHRTLVCALALATALIVTPPLRAWSGLQVELFGAAAEPWSGAPAQRLLAAWVEPLLAAREPRWSSLLPAYALSGVALLWLLGAAACVARAVWGRYRLRRCYRRAALAPAAVLARARAIAAELGIAAPEIRVAEGVACAFTLGVFSPLVVLGRETCDAPDDELDFVLRHELAHVARGDAPLALWLDMALGCFAGHPCRKRLAAELRFAREASVDSMVGGAAPLAYARYLLACAERLRSARAPAAAISMADTALERRIEMLTKTTHEPFQSTPRAWLSSSWLVASALALGSVVLLAPAPWGGPGGPVRETTSQRHVPSAVPSPPEPESHVQAGAVAVSGRLHPEVIRSVLRNALGGLRTCYEGLPAPRRALTAQLEFTIGPDGKVSDGHVQAEDRTLGTCMEAIMRTLVFPAPAEGSVSVVYPVRFAP